MTTIAIIAFFGLFEFLYTTLGLRNAAKTFQKFKFTDQVIAGLDFYVDILMTSHLDRTSSQNEAQHRKYLEILFVDCNSTV